VADAKAILAELKKYDAQLAAKPRWLVLNKIDMLAEDERAERIAVLTKEIGNDGDDQMQVFAISGLTKEGCMPMCRAIASFIAQRRTPVDSEETDIRFSSPN